MRSGDPLTNVQIPLTVTVLVRHDGIIIRELEDLDYHDKPTRVKIARTVWWAVHNGHDIEILPTYNYNERHGGALHSPCDRRGG